MNEIEEPEEILRTDQEEFPKKKRTLSHLQRVILAFAVAFVSIATIKWLPNDIFQIFVICVLTMAVWFGAKSKPPAR
ncbi:MAG: hypothetical protein HXS46_00500 [Theionarchaea archaeon]|nr:hypothetical protein [Theionarchaea archaeon]